jgi:hypothetical protein
MYHPQNSPLGFNPVLSSLDYVAFGLDDRILSSGAPASATGTTLQVRYVPFRIQSPYLITTFWWINGATVTGSTNVDAGIYNVDSDFKPLTKLTSTGNTVQSGTSSLQQVNLGSSYLLNPGMYYMALVWNQGTTTFYRKASNFNTLKSLGHMQETVGSVPLPATAAPVVLTATYTPIFGIASTTTI